MTLVLLLVSVAAAAQEQGNLLTVRASRMEPMYGQWVQVENARGTVLLDRSRCYTNRYLFPDGTYVDTVFCPNPRKSEHLPDFVHSWLTGYWTMVGDTLLLRHNTMGIDGMDALERYLVTFDNEFTYRARRLLTRQRGGNEYWVRPQLLEQDGAEE